ncbi:hypothetical protein PAPHI01_0790 [Pancytospora philotis]|nr:hypothetical protein PAPHI01_0790 [Pancytospora philotis]
MCIGNFCFLCLGMYPHRRIVRTPPGQTDPPREFMCMSCGKTGRAVYVERFNRFSLCCVPCCCTSDEQSPSLCCGNCYSQANNTCLSRCSGCDVYTSINSGYCPNCGQRKSGSNTGSSGPSNGDNNQNNVHYGQNNGSSGQSNSNNNGNSNQSNGGSNHSNSGHNSGGNGHNTGNDGRNGNN